MNRSVDQRLQAAHRRPRSLSGPPVAGLGLGRLGARLAQAAGSANSVRARATPPRRPRPHSRPSPRRYAASWTAPSSFSSALRRLARPAARRRCRRPRARRAGRDRRTRVPLAALAGALRERGRTRAAALVAVQRPVLDRDGAGSDGVQQRAVVGDEQDRAAEGAQRVLECPPALDVEVVGGLVEDQHVRAGLDEHGQRQAPALAAGEAAERLSASSPENRKRPSRARALPGLRPVARWAASRRPAPGPPGPSSWACWER